MKVLGYVNCYNRGINMVQEELEANGNGKAEFSFRLITAFETKVALAGNGLGEKLPENDPTNEQKTGDLPENLPETLTPTAKRIYLIMKRQNRCTYNSLASSIGVTRETIRVSIASLVKHGLIRRIGPDKGGHWEVVE